MRIDDPALFAVIVPTFEGTRFLKRALDYLLCIDFEGRIVLSDNSTGEHRAFVESCAESYPDLKLETHLYPHDVRFLDKMVDTLRGTQARFVMLHAHDDFMVPAAVERCVEFLDTHPGYSVARGRATHFSARKGAARGEVSLELARHQMRGYEQDDPLARVLDHLERYASTFYSVHERGSLIDAFSLTEDATKNVIFFQYLSSCIAVLNGKVWCSDDLFYLRQAHADSWSESLRQADYEHWPMLITSPRFSEYYAQFRNTLCSLVESRLGVPASDTAPRVDRAAARLFRRSFSGIEVDNPEQERFMQRLSTPGSQENRLLHSIAAFISNYPDTI